MNLLPSPASLILLWAVSGRRGRSHHLQDFDKWWREPRNDSTRGLDSEGQALPIRRRRVTRTKVRVPQGVRFAVADGLDAEGQAVR